MFVTEIRRIAHTLEINGKEKEYEEAKFFMEENGYALSQFHWLPGPNGLRFKMVGEKPNPPMFEIIRKEKI